MKYLYATLFLLATAGAHAQQSVEYETKCDCRQQQCDIGCTQKENRESDAYSKERLIGVATVKILSNSMTIVEIQESKYQGRTETWTLPEGATCKLF